MVNCDANGIRYGVISTHNIDPDVADELWYGPGAQDLSYAAALGDLEREVTQEADRLLEDGVLSAEDVADWIEGEVEERSLWIQIDEPNIEGEYEGVKYQISWLGGAPLLWIFEGPQGYCRSPCSPCVPNAGDLDSGYYMQGEPFDPVEEWGHFGYECYCVPRDWLSHSLKEE